MKDLVLSFRSKSRKLEEIIKKLGGVELQAVSVDGSELEHKIQHDSAGRTTEDFISYRWEFTDDDTGYFTLYIDMP